MNKFNLVKISDFLFYSFCFFILSLVFTSYFLPSPFSLVLALCLTALICLIIFPLISKKHQKNANFKAQKVEMENLKDYLALRKREQIFDLFFKVLTKKGYSLERKKGALFIKEKKLYVFPFFSFEELNKTQVVKIFNLLQKNEFALILTGDVSLDTLSFSQRFDGKIEVFTINEVFALLKETDLLPKCPKVKKKIKVKTILSGFFTKKRATKFFLLGLTFLICSFFVYVKVYYIVFGTLLMILALTSKFFGIAETNTKYRKLLD